LGIADEVGSGPLGRNTAAAMPRRNRTYEEFSSPPRLEAPAGCTMCRGSENSLWRISVSKVERLLVRQDIDALEEELARAKRLREPDFLLIQRLSTEIAALERKLHGARSQRRSA
jgi:hypothetical protein